MSKIYSVYFACSLEINIFYYIVTFIENENKQMWLPPIKEVMCMIDTLYLITLIYILFFGLLGITIIAIPLIIALAIILSKSE